MVPSVMVGHAHNSALPLTSDPLFTEDPSNGTSPRRSPKKSKVEPLRLTAQQSSLIKEDKSNAKLWTELQKAGKDCTVSCSEPQAPHSPSRPHRTL